MYLLQIAHSNNWSIGLRIQGQGILQLLCMSLLGASPELET